MSGIFKSLDEQALVYVVGKDAGVSQMFQHKLGQRITRNLSSAEMVVFTGGEDVTPFLYGEKPHKTTYFSMDRDMEEIKIFNSLCLDVPKVGICRGGQFLNVMSGGRLYQNVDKHAIHGKHIAVSFDLTKHYVTSTHHQMMIPHPTSSWVLLETKLSSFRETEKFKDTDPQGDDTEAVFYGHTNSLCFQPHPEYKDADDTRALFSDYLVMLFEADIKKLRTKRAATVKT